MLNRCWNITSMSLNSQHMTHYHQHWKESIPILEENKTQSKGMIRPDSWSTLIKELGFESSSPDHRPIFPAASLPGGLHLEVFR